MSAQSILCIARDEQLGLLETQLDQAIGASRCRPVFVVGDTGLGKTTLLRALEARLAARTQPVDVVWGRCSRDRESAPSLEPWLEVLAQLTGVTVPAGDGQQPGAAPSGSAALRSTLRELAPDLVELLVPGVGLAMRSVKLLRRHTRFGARLLAAPPRSPGDRSGEISAQRSQISEQVSRVLERAAGRRPLVLLLEDLHGADDASIDLIGRLTAHLAGRPVLMVGSLRREGVPAGSALPALLQAAASVDLDAVHRSSRQAFTRGFLDQVVPGVGEDFLTDTFRHTGGHPLLTAELIRSLIADGRLVRGPTAQWTLARAMDWSHLPSGVEEILAAQIDAVDPDLRRFLNAAAVEGETFTVELVSDLTRQPPVAVVQALNTIRQRHGALIEPGGTTRLGRGRITSYRFAHRLQREFLYARVDALEKPYLHQEMAQRLVALTGDDAGGAAAQIAYHFDQAGLMESGEPYHQKAADQSYAMCDLARSDWHLARALACEGVRSAAQQCDLLRKAARIARERGEPARAGELLAAASLDALDPARRCAVWADRASGQITAMQLDSARTSVAQALDAAALADDGGESRVVALRMLASVENRSGAYAAALAAIQEAFDIDATIRTSPHGDLANDLYQLGWACKEVGRNADSRRCLTECLAMLSELGNSDWVLMGRCHGALADLCLNEERYDDASVELQEAIAIWSRFDQHAEVGNAENTLANTANRRGNYAGALRYANQALDSFRTMLGDDHADLAFPETCLGEALLGLGRYGDAVETLQRALERRTRGGAPIGNVAWTRWLLGKAQVEGRGDDTGGMAEVRQARADLVTLGAATVSEVNEIDAWLARRGEPRT